VLGVDPHLPAAEASLLTTAGQFLDDFLHESSARRKDPAALNPRIRCPAAG
jgi:hypothetical protein